CCVSRMFSGRMLHLLVLILSIWLCHCTKILRQCTIYKSGHENFFCATENACKMNQCMKGCTKIAPAEFHNLVVLANRRLEQSEREVLNPRLYDLHNSSIMKGHSGYICGKTTVLNNLRFSILKAESFWHQLLYEGTYKHSRYLYASSDCASKCKWPIFPSTCQMVTYNDEIIKELYFRRMAHMILFECNTLHARVIGIIVLTSLFIVFYLCLTIACCMKCMRYRTALKAARQCKRQSKQQTSNGTLKGWENDVD
uniref:Uncharacterized protein n=1 Tax=Parascaris univalens TaxID=6257 RepID=A0A915BTT3_PARUN